MTPLDRGGVVLNGDVLELDSHLRVEARDLGARWDKARGAWTLPAARVNAAAVIDAIPEAEGLLDDMSVSWSPVEDPRLYDFQRDAVGRLLVARHGLLVCLSPGLGKTAVAIRAADTMVPDDQVVVVVPASLLPTWQRELATWSTVPGEVYVARGAIDHDALEAARWILMSWDGARRHHAVWTRARWPLWILDESVLTKSRSSQRFKALKKIRSRVGRFWMLSGNPTTRYADDLWAQLSLLWPKAFPSYWRFAERYCIVEENVWAKSVVGNRRNRDVMADASDLVLVVNQEDVLELPEYLFETVDVTLGTAQRREYDRMEKQFIAELEDGEKVIAKNEVARLMKLQQIASFWDGNSAKHDTLIEMLPSYEGPHLIWTHWREGAEALWTRLIAEGYAAAWVSGADGMKERDQTLEDFKKGLVEVLVLSIGVGKFGHTFTNAKTVWYVDKTWAADDYFQSLRRVRRIGLEHRPVVVTLRAPGTADVLVEDNLAGKLSGISKITKSRLAELLKGIGR